MLRVFPVLAVANGLLLVAAFGLGLWAAPGVEAHGWLGILALVATWVVHAVVYAYLRVSGRRLERVVRARGLPGWIVDQAMRNERKGLRFVLWSIMVIAAVAGLGVALRLRGGIGLRLAHLGASAAALAFNGGALAVEYAVILRHVRLLREVGRGGRTRALVIGEARP